MMLPGRRVGKGLALAAVTGLIVGGLWGTPPSQPLGDIPTAAAQEVDKKPRGSNADPVTKKAVRDTSIVEYLDDAYAYSSIIGGLLAILMLIYAGYRYITSYGDPEKIADAKDIIEKSLIGLGLLIIAVLLLETINPRTVDPCRPGQAGCGDIDFTQPDGGF